MTSGRHALQNITLQNTQFKRPFSASFSYVIGGIVEIALRLDLQKIAFWVCQ